MFPSLVTGLLASLSLSAAGSKPTLAIMPIVTPGLGNEASQVLDDSLLLAANQLGDYLVISKADVEALLGLSRMQDAMGCTDIVCSAEIGGALGAGYLLVARLAKIETRWYLSLRVIDVKMTRVLRAHQEDAGDNPSAFPSVARRAVFRLFERQTPEEIAAAESARIAAKQDADAKLIRDSDELEGRRARRRVALGFGGSVLALGVGTLTAGVALFVAGPGIAAIDAQYRSYVISPSDAAYGSVRQSIETRNQRAPIAVGLMVVGSAATLVGAIVVAVFGPNIGEATVTPALGVNLGGASLGLEGAF